MERIHRRRWPTPIQHDGRDYLTTEQVAKVLGVKVSTVYAYVSRGRLQSARIDGVAGSVFGVDEIEKLLSTGRARPPAGVVERIRTQLTYLHDDRLYYRGRDVAELARTTSFERVAELLWEQPWRTASRSPEPADIKARVDAALPRTARGVDRIRLTVDLLGALDPLRHRIDAATVASTTSSILEVVVGAPAGEPDDVGFAERLWPTLTDEPPTRERISLLDAALVLLADHDLAAGTVAARVAASARGSIYAVIGAGLGAFDGPMHGGATTLAHRFLAEALDDPNTAIAEHLRADDTVPGTGHVVYRHRDPRAATLLELMCERDARDPDDAADARVMPAVAALIEAVEPGTFLNSDLALAALALRYRMRRDAAETIFALARIVGWTAHALEEYGEKRLRFRPEGVYSGVRPTSG
ncbi:citrate synthase [Gordonia otitidis]|uniref:citrate synthase (unknown stereospecificity) n=1 Tax=Gordonia otitidis (strain DSM 44809 / CCUG 52243 / JCM 12355 / NBRC 100426 / IFM 10032) TaxID=1108044 RepID=H5TTW1_GORO1|nr:citrate synthase [Gordonia otitidis]GAB36919.1 putative citrate synthase [Gordonia otitidis NBRC 100426]